VGVGLRYSKKKIMYIYSFLLHYCYGWLKP
jgi:hypothetical protein